MHHIQLKILNQLMYTPALNYAKMRPKGVESNHFAYHLKQLICDGLIQKKDRSYSLTTKGLSFADRVSHDNMMVRVQPHIVTSVDITNDAGQTLLFKHMFQPYMDLYGFPQGRTHYDETVQQSATRELAEKTGLNDIKLEHRGMVYISAMQDGQCISKLLSHVFHGSVAGTPDLVLPSPKGECSWGDAGLRVPGQCMPGFLEIKRLLTETTDFFFAEITNALSHETGPTDPAV